MKRILTMMCVIAMSITAVNATETAKTPNQTGAVQQRMMEKRIQRDNAFERRLELTEVQKLKARQIRQSGHEKLMPVFEQIKAKKQEAEMIRRSRMAVQMQEEKLTVIDTELCAKYFKSVFHIDALTKDIEQILNYCAIDADLVDYVQRMSLER